MDWRIKGTIQGILARLPGGMMANDLLQRTLGGRRNVEAHIASKVEEDWLVHLEHMRELEFKLAGATVVEIGSGWLPVFPLCFALAGVRRCLSYDLHRHLTMGVLPETLARLERHLPAIAVAAGLPEGQVRARHGELMQATDGRDLLRRAGIEYHAPADATRTGLAAGSVDLVISNSVLEHVPALVLGALLAESRRILRPGGLSLHGVNCGDHYAYIDRRITAIHYLRYSEQRWRLWNNDILFQNRLRASDFLAAAAHAGLAVVRDWQRAKPELLARLPELPIDPQFRHYSDVDLCCTSIDFAATPTAVGTVSGQE